MDAIPAVAYYRMSSAKQDRSIQDQRSEVEPYAAARGYQIIRCYVDEAISGRRDDRPELTRLKNDAQHLGDFQVVLCWDQDRLSREDHCDAFDHWLHLRRYGVRIETVRQGALDIESLPGVIQSIVVQHGKAQYVKDLAANSSRGRRQLAKQGVWPARAPYGYRRNETGRLELGPDTEVATVRFIFHEYTHSHTSLRAMAENLNDRGIPSPTGQKWTECRVRNILIRLAYAGRTAFNRMYNNCTPRPESEWIWVEVPPIVSQEQWDAAQGMLAERKRATCPHRSGGPYLLTGLVFCANCGGKMVGSKRRHGRVYTCRNYNDRGRKACTCNAVKQVDLARLVTAKLEEYLLSPEILEGIRERIIRKLTSDAPPDPRPAMKEQLRNLDKEIRSNFKELKRLPNDLHALAVEELRALKESRDRIAQNLESYNPPRSLAPTTRDVDRVIGRLAEFGKHLQSTDTNKVRHAFQQLIERIDLRFRVKSSQKWGRTELTKGVLQLRSQLLSSPTPAIITTVARWWRRDRR